MLDTTLYTLIASAARFLGSHHSTSTLEPLHITRLAPHGDGTYDRTEFQLATAATA